MSTPAMKPPNPFRPGKRLTRPELFAGRSPQLADGFGLLRQAAAGNVRHGLITGDRGIGKSSLSSQIQGLARGLPEFSTLLHENAHGGPQLRFLVSEHVAQKGQTVQEIVTGLIQELDREHGRGHGFKIDWELDFKILKARITEATTPRDLTNRFVDAMEETWRTIERGADGILLVIDEVDRVVEDSGLPTFLKVATEVMTARGLEHILVMPVGMVGVRDLFAADHESVPRIFETIHVPLLRDNEAADVIERALSGTEVRVHADVQHEMVRLADGFPQPLHLLGEQAYDADADMVIDRSDLDAALTAIVTEKSKEEMEGLLIAAGSGKNREIVQAMANYPEFDVPIAHVCDVLDVTQPEISSNIGLLMKREVIVRVDRGIYRIKDKLFRIYVRTLKVLGAAPVERRPRRRRSGHRTRQVET